jgi:predicted GNAT family acetyltransferase
MSATQITRTEQAEEVTYTLTVDGVQASFLTVDAATRKVCNVETGRGFERQGFARALWEAANAEAECFHAVEHHRTAEGDLFAQAVGGETISAELDHVDVCSVCTGDDIDDDEMEW